LFQEHLELNYEMFTKPMNNLDLAIIKE